MNLASPPVSICLFYNVDDIARGEGQIVRILKIVVGPRKQGRGIKCATSPEYAHSAFALGSVEGAEALGPRPIILDTRFASPEMPLGVTLLFALGSLVKMADASAWVM